MALISLGSNKITSTKQHKTAPYIPRERERRQKSPLGGKRKGSVFPSHHHSAVTAARLVGWMGASRFIGLLARLDQPPRFFFFFLLLPSSSPRAHHDGKGGRHLGISRLRCSPSLLSRPRERRACVTEIRRRRPRDRPPRLFLDWKPPRLPPFSPPPSLPKRPI